MSDFMLNNGNLIPKIGLGCNTFGKINRDYQAELDYDLTPLLQAIKLGYRHLDTAIAYRNEAVVGQAVKESGLKRTDFFLTTKIPPEAAYLGSITSIDQAISASLANLQTDYLDLFLIHHPSEDFNLLVIAWQRLEYWYQQGKIKNIGVSNFDINLLAKFIDAVQIRPAVNQIESNPSNFNHALIEYCQTQNILSIANSPLKKVSLTQRASLAEIGQAYQKSWAEILLAYQLNRQVAVIPKSYDQAHQAANLSVASLVLTTEEMAKIAGL